MNIEIVAKKKSPHLPANFLLHAMLWLIWFHTRIQKPKLASSSLEHGDHPEIDSSEELDREGISKYQSLIGSTNFVVQLGRCIQKPDRSSTFQAYHPLSGTIESVLLRQEFRLGPSVKSSHIASSSSCYFEDVDQTPNPSGLLGGNFSKGDRAGRDLPQPPDKNK
jgi:hypothetical protein